MGRQDWLELFQLAEVLCPTVLLDLRAMLEADAQGLLLWLRAKASREG